MRLTAVVSAIALIGLASVWAAGPAWACRATGGRHSAAARHCPEHHPKPAHSAGRHARFRPSHSRWGYRPGRWIRR